MNEGLGKVLRFGAYDASVMARLRWMADTLGPALSRALAANGPVDLKMMTGQALQMGDECHNRNVAATSLFARLIAPALVRSVDRRHSRGRAGLSPGQQSLLSECVHGGLQSQSGCRPRRPGLDAGDGHGAQRSRVRDSRQRRRIRAGSRRRRRCPTGCISPASGQTTPIRISATARLPRPPASAALPWPPRQPSCASSAASGRRHPLHRRDGPHHAGSQPGLRPAQPELCGHAHGHRPAAGGRERHGAGDQHRHRPPPAGRGSDRRGHRARAARSVSPPACAASAEAWVWRRSMQRAAVIAIGGNALIARRPAGHHRRAVRQCARRGA